MNFYLIFLTENCWCIRITSWVEHRKIHPFSREAIGGYPLDVVDQDGKGGGLDGTAWRIIPVSTASS